MAHPEKDSDLASPDLCLHILKTTLQYSRGRDYAGHNKHDGLNSPILGPILGWAKWPRLVAIQSVMRAPVNIRPLLLVPLTRNPKGIGLFASAWLDLYAVDRREEDFKEAEKLLDWLLENPSRGFKGLSWGYPYPWQDLGFYARRHMPNRVVTCWVGFAFLEAYRQTAELRYRNALPEIAEFLTSEPNILEDSKSMKCFSYVPDHRVTWAVMDVPALMGAYLAEAGVLLERSDYVEEAKRLINWVVDKQTDYGAWFYTHPSEDSPITHDNYHTAIVLDCLDRYRLATGDQSFETAYWEGLEYYRDNLFTHGGAPRWRNDKEYPYDIHGAASGILCFTRAATREPSYWRSAQAVLNWTLEHLHDPRGFFYYQRTKWFTKRFCLLRWSNAWMCRALAFALRKHKDYSESPN
jgi:rhamnogalacturonyl hydrolase YesR